MHYLGALHRAVFPLRIIFEWHLYIYITVSASASRYGGSKKQACSMHFLHQESLPLDVLSRYRITEIDGRRHGKCSGISAYRLPDESKETAD